LFYRRAFRASVFFLSAYIIGSLEKPSEKNAARTPYLAQAPTIEAKIPIRAGSYRFFPTQSSLL
jgi:hypothetical protein